MHIGNEGRATLHPFTRVQEEFRVVTKGVHLRVEVLHERRGKIGHEYSHILLLLCSVLGNNNQPPKETGKAGTGMRLCLTLASPLSLWRQLRGTINTLTPPTSRNNNGRSHIYPTRHRHQPTGDNTSASTSQHFHYSAIQHLGANTHQCP